MRAHQLLLIAFCAILISSMFDCSYSANSGSHHLFLGSRVWGDKLIEKKIVKKSSSILQIVKEKISMTGDGRSNITMIQALDQKTNGNGATAVLEAGGPGHNFATLSFKSKRGHGINFVVEVYGKYI